MLNDASHHILHRLVQFSELLDTVLNDLLGPLRNLVSIIDCVSVEDASDDLADELLDLR